MTNGPFELLGFIVELTAQQAGVLKEPHFAKRFHAGFRVFGFSGFSSDRLLDDFGSN